MSNEKNPCLFGVDKETKKRWLRFKKNYNWSYGLLLMTGRCQLCIGVEEFLFCRVLKGGGCSRVSGVTGKH